jgi:hypothetical protein
MLLNYFYLHQNIDNFETHKQFFLAPIIHIIDLEIMKYN